MLGNISSLCVFYLLSVLPRWQSGELGSRACGLKAEARGVVYVIVRGWISKPAR